MIQLTENALVVINTAPIRARLMIALEASENSIYRWIRDNDDNLTKAAALEVIKEETGLQDHEILERVSKEKMAQS